MSQGKDVKILCVGRKGQDQLRRVYGKQIIETIELRGIKQIGFEQAEMIAKKIVALFDAEEFDVCTLFFSRFRSVIAQVPTALQIIPPLFEKAKEGDKEAGPAAAYELSLIHISEPTRLGMISYAVFCLKKKK